MALQGLHSGGIWTTERAYEGPASSGLNGLKTRCAESPNGEHSWFASDTEVWQVA
jgi:hypothetical protein